MRVRGLGERLNDRTMHIFARARKRVNPIRYGRLCACDHFRFRVPWACRVAILKARELAREGNERGDAMNLEMSRKYLAEVARLEGEIAHYEQQWSTVPHFAWSALLAPVSGLVW